MASVPRASCRTRSAVFERRAGRGARGDASKTALLAQPVASASERTRRLRGGRAADAPRAGDRRDELRPRASQRRQRPQQPGQLLQATNRLAEAEPLMRRALAIDETSFGPDHPNVAIRLNNLAAVAAGHQPAGRGRAADAPRAGDRRDELRPRPSQRRHRPQQPGAVAAGHQPAGRGRAADAPRAGDRRDELRPRPSQRRHRPQQPGRSCCRPPTGWPRPSR